MKANKSSHYFNPDKAKKRLFYGLLVFVVAMSLPLYFVLDKVYSQLENETWYRQRNQAEALVERIERQLLEKLQPEQERPIAEYSFFNVMENPLLQSTTVNLSPLAQWPPKTDIPGLIGYFRIDPDGSFHIPALPDLDSGSRSGLSAEELASRLALKDQLQGLLALSKADVPESLAADKQQNAAIDQGSVDLRRPSTQRFNTYFGDREQEQEQAFETEIKAVTVDASKSSPSLTEKKAPMLSEEKLQQLNITTSLWKQKREKKTTDSDQKSKFKDEYRQQARKETVKIPVQSTAGALFNRNRSLNVDDDRGRSESDRSDAQTGVAESKGKVVVQDQDVLEPPVPVSILSFESEVSPLQMITLDGRYFCFYRNAWSGKARYVQGFIVDDKFFRQQVKPVLDHDEGLQLSSVLIVDRGNVLRQFKMIEADPEVLLFRRTLTAPFQHLELIVNSGPFSTTSGRAVLDMVVMALIVIIAVGFILFYRLGAGQIELTRRQRNFISSVSHELKTPLTSIRMYSEMLRAGWVEDTGRVKSYYDYIFFESERLSRLIGNVLQLAKLDNHPEQKCLVTVNAGQLLTQIQGKVSAQLEAANYRLNLISPTDEPGDAELGVDEDAFFQIMINLVDNAIKFSRQSDRQTIDIGYRIGDSGKEVVFYVRDYGPGIDKEQRKKIFKLFYRAGDELTRTQPGTGIGLALVAQLAESMGATVDQVNRQPGAEFQVRFVLK